MTETDELEFSECDLNDLREAKTRLEYPSLTAKLADLVGRPIEAGFKLLPKNWNKKVNEATETALFKGLDFSIRTMGKAEARPSRDWLHKLVVVGSGAAAGAVGFYSLIVELPFSTCVILRSIAILPEARGTTSHWWRSSSRAWKSLLLAARVQEMTRLKPDTGRSEERSQNPYRRQPVIWQRKD